MSVINQRTDFKQSEFGFIRGRGFILALICIALALVLANVIFLRAPVGSGISNDVLVVGP